MKQSRLSVVLVSALALTGLCGCNMFSPVDHPSGDAQELSAARAAFDSGDFATALADYQKLSSSDSDVQLSEEAYVGYAQAGATMASFAEAFGTGSGVSIATGLTNMAGLMKPYTGAASRTLIFNSFQNYISIQNPTLQQIVRFLGALAMSAITIAEDAGSNGILTKTDICTNASDSNPTPASCILPVTAITGGNGSPANMTTGGAGSLSNFNSAQASLTMFNAAVAETLSAMTALQNLGALGTFGGNITSFSNTISSGGAANLSGDSTGANYRFEIMLPIGMGI